MKHQLENKCINCGRLKDSLLSGLSAENLEKISEHKSCNFYKKGTIFIHEGSRPTGVFCINAGKTKIYRHGDGRDHIINIAKEGDLIGFKALLAEDTYPVSAETLEDCSICFIPKQDFLESLYTSPSFTNKILKAACKELEVMTEKLTEIAQKTVRERLAITLLMLKETYGSDSAEEGSTVINLKREDIANIVGTATETLIRLLHDFKEDGLVEIDGRKVIVLNPRGLMKEAHVFS